MSIQAKPDESIFASQAKDNEVSAFPDIPRGWGVTLDTMEGIPPMEWFNALFKRIDQHIQYLMQYGIPEWSLTLEYPEGALIQYQGTYYQCLIKNKGKTPENTPSHWAIFQVQGLDIDALMQSISIALSGINSNILEHTRRLENIEDALKLISDKLFLPINLKREANI